MISLIIFSLTMHTHSCQPTAWPFWVGFAGSFVVVTVINWVLFAMVALYICSSCFSISQEEKSQIKLPLSNLLVAVTLSIFFTVAWIFFLISVADPLENVNFASQYIYAIFFAVHSILLLILYAVRSPDIRSEWVRMWYIFTCKKDIYHVRETAVLSTDNSQQKEIFLSNKSPQSQELERGIMLKESSSLVATEFVKAPDTSFFVENSTATSNEMTEKDDEKKQINFHEEMNASTHL